MRTYYEIQLNDRSTTRRELHGEAVVRAGRYLIAKTLLEHGAATVDPLSPGDPLIFSAGPFAGTSFSNANRTSVGCRSPLTGGIKEANGGGTFSYALGQLEDRRVHAARRLAGVGGAALQEGRHARLRRRRAVSRQGQLRGEDDLLRARYGKKVCGSRCAVPSADARACSAASPSATRTAAPRGWPPAAGSAR